MSDDPLPLARVCAEAATRFAIPFGDAHGLRAFRAEAPVPVHADGYEGPEALSFIGLGWTGDGPVSSYAWIELRPCGGDHLVIAADDDSFEAFALLRLEGALSADGLGAVLEAIGAGVHGVDEPTCALGYEVLWSWPTEVEAVYSGLPRASIRRFLRRISHIPDLHGGPLPPEFDDVDETAPPADVEAAFGRYVARILPAE